MTPVYSGRVDFVEVLGQQEHSGQLQQQRLPLMKYQIEIIFSCSFDLTRHDADVMTSASLQTFVLLCNRVAGVYPLITYTNSRWILCAVFHRSYNRSMNYLLAQALHFLQELLCIDFYVFISPLYYSNYQCFKSVIKLLSCNNVCICLSIVLYLGSQL